MKNAYIIITDMHIINKILVGNRVSYADELKQVENVLFDIIDKYDNTGCIVNLIFLGDIYHKGYSDPIASINGNNLLILLAKKVNKMFTVVGNHELSYYKNNPFYTLFNELQSNKIKQLGGKITKPVGIMQVLNIVDYLQDGDTFFSFNHYGCGVSQPKDGFINVGLFHQELVCKEILNDMKSKFKIDNWISDIKDLDSNNVFKGYDYCFLGHLHKVYGTYNIEDDAGNKTRLYYLGSLGRTNHLEVQDNFLERNLPVVIINNGKFEKIEDNYFLLPGRKDCIHEDIVLKQQEIRKNIKENKSAKNYEAFSDDPVKNLLEIASDNVQLSRVTLDLLNSDMDSIGKNLEVRIKDLERGDNIWI